MSGNGRINATVVVLGDLGRSPRMQYHARSLADLGAEVDLVGYAGSDLPESIARHPKIMRSFETTSHIRRRTYTGLP